MKVIWRMLSGSIVVGLCFALLITWMSVGEFTPLLEAIKIGLFAGGLVFSLFFGSQIAVSWMYFGSWKWMSKEGSLE